MVNSSACTIELWCAREVQHEKKLSKPTIALFLWLLFVFVFHNRGLNTAKAIGKQNDPTNIALFQYPLKTTTIFYLTMNPYSPGSADSSANRGGPG